MKRTLLLFTTCAVSILTAQATTIHVQACAATLPAHAQHVVKNAEANASVISRVEFGNEIVWVDCDTAPILHNYRVEFWKKTPKHFPKEKDRQIGRLRGTLIIVRWDFLKYLIGRNDAAMENAMGATIASLIAQRLTARLNVEWDRTAFDLVKLGQYRGFTTGYTVDVKDLR